MISEDIFDTLASMVINTQLLVKDGWVFNYEGGILSATNGKKNYTSYSCVESLFEDIFRDMRKEFDDKMIDWYKVHKELCPNCKTMVPINTYACSDCGWKL